MDKHPWKIVYVVTAWNKNGYEPIVSVFDNENAAEACQNHMRTKYDDAVIDKTPIFKTFISTNRKK